jgi:hypothetical protein
MEPNMSSETSSANPIHTPRENPKKKLENIIQIIIKAWKQDVN